MNSVAFYAHKSEDGRKQTVLQHLQGTAKLCAAFAAEFGEESQGRVLGLSHDIGKYSAEFQNRLLNNGHKVDHATAGAFECYKKGQGFAAFCVAGHHGGIPSWGGRGDTPDRSTMCARMKRAEQLQIPNYGAWRSELQLPPADDPKGVSDSPISEDFMTRMLYSCLTDADYLDTERFAHGKTVNRGCNTSVSALTEKLDAYVAGWFPPDNALNEQRCRILERCQNAGDEKEPPNRLFSLTVPTGGGKTIASLMFALHHAKTNGLRRIIYVIPYTSIIEQTAAVFRSILGEDCVLEHHSGVTYDMEDELSPENQKLAYAEVYVGAISHMGGVWAVYPP